MAFKQRESGVFDGRAGPLNTANASGVRPTPTQDGTSIDVFNGGNRLTNF